MRRSSLANRSEMVLSCEGTVRADLMQWQSAIRDLSRSHGEGDLALRRKRGEAHAEVGDLDRQLRISKPRSVAIWPNRASHVPLRCLARCSVEDRDILQASPRASRRTGRTAHPESVNLAAWRVSLVPALPPDIDVPAVLSLLQDEAIAIQGGGPRLPQHVWAPTLSLGYVGKGRPQSGEVFVPANRPPFDWVILSMCWKLK